MTLLTTQPIALAGTTPAYVAASSTDTITADTGLFLHVKNGGGSNDIVTITDPGVTASGSAATNPTVTVVQTSGDKMIRLPESLRNSANPALITVAHSFTTSVTEAVLRVSN